MAYPLDIDPNQDHLKISKHNYVRPDINQSKGSFDVNTKEKVYKGASFDIWDNDTGEYYAWFDKEKYLNKLENKYKLSQYKTENFKTLPFERPRIVFRKVTRGNDTRTMRAALAPPNTIHTDASQFIFFPRGNRNLFFDNLHF